MVVTISPAANKPPEPRDDPVTVRAGVASEIDVLRNDEDEDPSSLTIELGPGAPPWISEGTGVLLATPPPDAVAGQLEPFTYQVSDGVNPPADALVTVMVLAADAENQPPVAVDDVGEATSGPVVIDLIGNDEDPDQENSTLQMSPSISDGRLGSVVPSADGRRITYTPFAEVSTVQVDEFTYEVIDGRDGSDTGTGEGHLAASGRREQATDRDRRR